MSKRRISEQQRRRIQRKQQKEITNDALHPEKIGLVIAHYGTKVDLESTEGHLITCRLRQHLGPIACGDQVVFQSDAHLSHVVTAILPRKSLLARQNLKYPPRPIAANIDQVFIVSASIPTPTPHLLDSYLVAVETLQLQPIIVWNKIDLLTVAEKKSYADWLTQYENMGYHVLSVSADQKIGLTALQAALKEHSSVLVGQSGVGKSSLVAALSPEFAIACRQVSESTLHGKHTTSTARLYHLPTGGTLIDSPGVRRFGLWSMSIAEIAYGFIEFRPYLNQCQFNDCQHRNESGCRILRAVDEKIIHLDRHESYKALITKYVT